MRLTAFKPVPVSIVGQSYEHRSTAVSIQKTMNLIPAKELTGAESSLTSWPGLKSFYSGTGVNRGMHVFASELYKVTGNTLYKISSLGVATSLGTISGGGRCVFADDGTNMIITTGGDGYQLTGTTLTQITDTDFQNGNSVTYLNQQMIYDGNGGQFQVSDVGDPDSLQPNNFATAESAPDNTIRVFSFKERVYVFGTATIETWYNSGVGNPPFARVNGGTMNVGLAAVHSVQATDEYCYFLGDDRRVYRFSSHQPQNITSIGISHQLDLIGDVSNAHSSIVSVEGQSFYILTAGNKTFAFNEDSGAWFNLSTNADEDKYVGESFVECYGKRLCADGGNVLELDLDTYTDNGAVKIQERIIGPITSKDLGLGHSRVVMSRLWLHMQAGVGIISGQGSRPQLMVSASFDGGQSFTNEDDVLIGRQGQGNIRVKWDNMRSFDSMFIKIRCSDPVFLAIYGATLEVKPGGI